MLSNRIFQITFLISLIAHGVILFQNPNLNPFPINKKEEKIEVNYLNEIKVIKQSPKRITLKKERPLKSRLKITPKKITPPPFIDREEIFNKNKEAASRNITFIKPVFTKPDIIQIKKKITLPPVDLDKIKNISYLNYYQSEREKIRRTAYQNYTRTDTGEVYLSFSISKDGDLKEMRLIGERSSGNSYLRDIALRSIKNASPFPNFPKELDYPHLTFNVVISFEIE